MKFHNRKNGKESEFLAFEPNPKQLFEFNDSRIEIVASCQLIVIH